MIYVTGDTHGRHDVGKLHARQWPEGQGLSREDYLVILGDFGAIWDWGTDDRALLAWYEAQPWTTLFVDGNHENFDLIDAFEVSEMFGGRVQVVPGYPHVVHLMRGEVYELPVARGGEARGETARCFVMGGAPSIDVAYRVDDFFGEIEHFVGLVEGGVVESPVMSLADSIACARILDLAREGFAG
jgi:hypothetical protein